MKEEFELKLPDLILFVKESFHDNLYLHLTYIRELINQNDRYPKKLTKVLKVFIQDLLRHLVMEENDLYVNIKSDKKEKLRSSINQLINEHDQMKLDLLTIREMTNNYQDETSTKSNFYEYLKEMDRVILSHVQIQNNILFPMLLSTY